MSGMESGFGADISLESIRKAIARKSHLRFIQHCWSSGEEYAVGRHTRTICHLIDEAVEDFKHGKATYLVVKVHPRAGKSEILSQNLTAHFIGAFPDKEVMICCYNSTLAEKNSRLARKIIAGEKYKELYPNIDIEGGVAQWNIAGYKAMVTASGLLSGVTGNGYSLGMVDDYIQGPEAAESQVIRDKIWEEFRGSFFTRRAPVSITIILATQWHVDDIIGRIEDVMNPQSKNYKRISLSSRLCLFQPVTARAMCGWRRKMGLRLIGSIRNGITFLPSVSSLSFTGSSWRHWEVTGSQHCINAIRRFAVETCLIRAK